MKALANTAITVSPTMCAAGLPTMCAAGLPIMCAAGLPTRRALPRWSAMGPETRRAKVGGKVQ
jgi:hypothetical protein